jgi:hypothetical protein
MNRNIFTYFGLAFLVLWGTGAGAQAPVKMHRVQDSTRDGSGWYYAKSTEGHFSVLLPYPFNDFTMTSNDTSNRVLSMYVVGSKNRDGMKFSAMETYPLRGSRPDLNRILDDFRQEGTVISNVQRGPNEISFHIVDARQVADAKYVLTDHSLFMMMVESPAQAGGLPDGDKEMFFNSLKTMDQLNALGK